MPVKKKRQGWQVYVVFYLMELRRLMVWRNGIEKDLAFAHNMHKAKCAWVGSRGPGGNFNGTLQDAPGSTCFKKTGDDLGAGGKVEGAQGAT